MRQKRLARILKLIALISSGGHANSKDLARAMKINRRTVFRDLRLLADAGVPTKYDPELGSYVIGENWARKFSQVTSSQAVALLACAHTSPYAQLFPIELAQATSSIQARMPQHEREISRRILRVCCAVHGEGQTNQKAVDQLHEVMRALKSDNSVRITHCPHREGAIEQTKLSSCRLTYCNGSWNIEGRSSVHRGTRCFALAELVRVEVIEEDAGVL